MLCVPHDLLSNKGVLGELLLSSLVFPSSNDLLCHFFFSF